MTEFTVHTTYREFDDSAGGTRLFCRTEKINADDKETAKSIAWQRLLGENSARAFDRQNARKSHRE